MTTVLIVEDHEAVSNGVSRALRPHFEVVVAATARAAGEALDRGGVDVVVLDYFLGEGAEDLQQQIAGLCLPVVMISGMDPGKAGVVAQRMGWPFLPKPFTAEAICAKVREALGVPSTLPPPPTEVALAVRPTTVPPPMPVGQQPQDVAPAPGRMPSDAPLSDDPSVARMDLGSRRLLRGFCALLIAGLTFYGDATGHPVSAVVVVTIGALGMGVSAAVDAMRKRPGATAAGGTALIALALGGTLLHLPAAGPLAALGAAVATFLVDRARET